MVFPARTARRYCTLCVLKITRFQCSSSPRVSVWAIGGGLDGGADDDVFKPYEMAELRARMRAVLCRKGRSAAPVLCNRVVSPVTREASVNGTASKPLSSREFSLFQALLLRPSAILSRSDLEDRLYG